MVIQHDKIRHQNASMMLELIVALGILVAVLFPVGFSFVGEQKECRMYYYRAVAMEIVDGEMEIMRAGAWQKVSEGTHPFVPKAAAATNLPPGKFVLMRDKNSLRLEWLPEQHDKGGAVVRELHLVDL